MPQSMDLFESFDASFGLSHLDISTFAEDSRFCGKVLYPRQRLLLKLFFLEDRTDYEERILDHWINGGAGGSEIQISPYIRERIDYLRSEGYKHFREITLVGGRRASKGLLTGIALAKVLYDTLHLQNPNEYYGLDPDKEIYFVCMAASESQAKEMQFSDFASTVNSCEAMQENIHKVQEREFSVNTQADLHKMQSWQEQGRRVQRDISKLRAKALPANARTARGYTIMGSVFDELAHWLQGESDQSDASVFDAVIPSMDQFGIDAIQFNCSSPYTKIGKLFERYEIGMAEDNGLASWPESFSLRFPSWATFEGWQDDEAVYLGAKKCITVSPDWDIDARKEDGSFYHSQADRQAINIARHEEAQNPTKYKVERRGEFAEVIDAYLEPRMVDRMFAGRPVDLNGDGNEYYEPLKTNWDDSSYLHEYRIHIDPSSTTAGFGFCLAHTEEITLNGRKNIHVVVDILKRWDARDFPNEVIDWHSVLDEIYYYINIFRPREVTMDQFSKGAGIQMLREKLRQGDISETRLYESTATLQHNWDVAEIFKTAVYQNLVHAPFDIADAQYAMMELKYLQEIRTGRVPRVEHQEMGPVQTSDMFDTLKETVAGLIGNLVARQVRHELQDMPLAAGSPGGFQIGDMEGRGSHPNHRMREWYKTGKVGEQRVPGNRSRSAAFYGNNRPMNPARGFGGGRPGRRSKGN